MGSLVQGVAAMNPPMYLSEEKKCCPAVYAIRSGAVIGGDARWASTAMNSFR